MHMYSMLTRGYSESLSAPGLKMLKETTPSLQKKNVHSDLLEEHLTKGTE